MQRTIRSVVAAVLAAGLPMFAASPGGNPTHPHSHRAASEPALAHVARHGAAGRASATRRAPGHASTVYKEPFTVSRHGRHPMPAQQRSVSAAELHRAARTGHLRAVSAPARSMRLRATPAAARPLPVAIPRAYKAALPQPANDASLAATPLTNTLLPAPTHDILLSGASASIPPLPLDPALLLRGSHESLLRQNGRAQADGLERIQDDSDIRRQVAAQTLVPLPETAQLLTDSRLPDNRRYTRPWTARFLRDISSAFGAQFGGQLVVTSAVRTVEFQRQLIHINGNAAPPEGEAASPHLYGGVVDLGKHGMSARQIAWMREYLRPLVEAGKIDVAEEFRQACFHISVYKSYVDKLPQQQLAHAGHIPAPGTADAAIR